MFFPLTLSAGLDIPTPKNDLFRTLESFDFDGSSKSDLLRTFGEPAFREFDLSVYAFVNFSGWKKGLGISGAVLYDLIVAAGGGGTSGPSGLAQYSDAVERNTYLLSVQFDKDDQVRDYSFKLKQPPHRAVPVEAFYRLREMDEDIRVFSGYAKRWKDPLSFVNSIVISPDSRLIAAGYSNNTVRIWDLATGRFVHRLHGQVRFPSIEKSLLYPIKELDFSPDGTLLATVGMDRGVKIWDINKGETRAYPTSKHKNLYEYEVPVSLKFLPDGNSIFTARGRRLTLWDVETGLEEWKITTSDANIASLAIGPSNELAASLGKNGNITLIDLKKKEQICLIPGRFTDVSFSPDGKYLGASTSFHFVFWSMNEIQDILDGREKNGPQGLAQISEQTGRHLLHIDPSDNREWYSDVSFSFLADGRTVLICNPNSYLRFFDLTKMSVEASLPVRGFPEGDIVTSPDGRLFALKSGIDIAVCEITDELRSTIQDEKRSASEASANPHAIRLEYEVDMPTYIRHKLRLAQHAESWNHPLVGIYSLQISSTRVIERPEQSNATELVPGDYFLATIKHRDRLRFVSLSIPSLNLFMVFPEMLHLPENILGEFPFEEDTDGFGTLRGKWDPSYSNFSYWLRKDRTEAELKILDDRSIRIQSTSERRGKTEQWTHFLKRIF